MKLKLFLIAASAMALATSCSSDEVVTSNENANAIKFSVVANNASRSAEYWCNYNLPKQFNVWAEVGVTYDATGNTITAGGSTYFAGESFSKADDGSSWNIDGAFRYWPSEEVTFYAAKIKADEADTNFADFKWNVTGNVVGTPTIEMTTKQKASEQNDLLYALTKSTRTAKTATTEQKTAANYNDGVANINFRHALSQIVFKAQNQNPNIVVKIEEVVVCNINNKGTFTFPSALTDKNLEKHDQTGNINTLDPDSISIGKWSAQSIANGVKETTTEVFTRQTVKARKTVGEGESATLVQADVVNLTDNTAGKKEGNVITKENAKYSLLLIPQHVDPWAGTDKPAAQDGAYFKVKCTIQNVADGKGGENGDVYLWGKADTTTEGGLTTSGADYIYVPVEILWNPGKKYIYTIIFSESGTGGYDKDGDPVLIPIKFNLTVDDFAVGKSIDVDADEGN